MTKIYFGFRHGNRYRSSKMVTDAFFTLEEAREAMIEYKKTSKRMTQAYEGWKGDKFNSASSKASAGRDWRELDKACTVVSRDLHGVTRTVNIEAA